jgi:hypothetical protein
MPDGPFDGVTEADGFAVGAGSAGTAEQGSRLPREAESLGEVGNRIRHGCISYRNRGEGCRGGRLE